VHRAEDAFFIQRLARSWQTVDQDREWMGGEVSDRTDGNGRRVSNRLAARLKLNSLSSYIIVGKITHLKT